MKIGMIGLGRMGGNMAKRLAQKGHEVVGYDRSGNGTAKSLAELVKMLPAPRAVWVMVPSGAPTEACIDDLTKLMSPGDIIIDGGNTNFNDSVRHGKELAAKGFGFVDSGTSGGIWGLTEGYCLMVGGQKEHVDRLMPIFTALACDGGFAHVGGCGAGHYTKMVHNGVEYGMMQAFGEGYEILRASDLGIDVDKAIEVWRLGSVVRSWLLDLLAKALKEDPGLEHIAGYAADSGEGRWTVNEAVRLGVPAHVLTASLYTRFTSRQDDSPTMKAVAALRNQFGGHAVKAKE